MATEPTKASYRTLIEVERLEPYLKFPSGLTINQAKQNAKALKKAQNISQTEAMKIVCWGNGLTYHIPLWGIFRLRACNLKMIF